MIQMRPRLSTWEWSTWLASTDRSDRTIVVIDSSSIGSMLTYSLENTVVVAEGIRTSARSSIEGGIC